MRSLVFVLSAFLCVSVNAKDVHVFNLVDTAGNVIKQEDLGDMCRPTWKLSNGDVMVFSTSATDVALLKEKLIESGMTDQERLNRWLKSAENTDCTNRAGLNCSDGKCSSGTCQKDTNKNGTACLCK
jgi:hypothetical protein